MSASLLQVTERNTLVHWFEAIAIVQGTCDGLLTAGAVGPPKLDLGDVFIHPSGDVTVKSGNPLDALTVTHLGAILGTLCGSEETPVQLRLLITEATAPSPVFPSVSALAEKLSYYERPGRSELIRAVYERWEATPEDARAPVAAAQETPTPKKRKRQALWMPFLAAACALASIGIFAMWRLEGAQPDGNGNAASKATTTIRDVASRATTAVTETIRSGAAAIKSRLGLPADAPPPAEPVLEAKTKTPPTRRARLKARRPDASFEAFDVVAPPAAREVAREPERIASGGTAATASPSVAPPPDGGSDDDVLYDLYDNNDRDVTAPISIRPQLPRSLPPGVKPEDLAQVELIIGPDGSVESVKLLSMPRRPLDIMLLSAAKSWVFAPARRNNVPVRYKHRILITAP